MILCCGEALIDMLPRSFDGGETGFAPHAGGAVFNTSIALGRLGVGAGYFGGLSTDLFGARLVAALEASGVDHSLCPRSDRPTTLAFVTLTDGQARYAFYDENTAGRMLQQEDLPKLGDAVEALFFGGISLVSQPQADSYATLCCSDRSLPVMIDPNIRPGFIKDEAEYRARLARMLARADIVKISDEDLDWYGARAEDLLQQAPVVLLTRGAEGVDLVTRDGTHRIAARTVEVVDTVGAGDTFNAGFLAGLKRDGLLRRDALAATGTEGFVAAVELGIRAAAVTVSRAGANPPWEQEL